MRPLTLRASPSRNDLSCSGVGRSGSASRYACALTTPLVPGVQASTSATSASFAGETMCAVSRSFTQPGCPKSHGSRWPLVKPHDAISLIAHSPAALRLGDPVTRGPYTSASTCRVCMIFEWVFSSWRIFVSMSASRRDWAASGQASDAAAISVERRLSMAVILPCSLTEPEPRRHEGTKTHEDYSFCSLRYPKERSSSCLRAFVAPVPRGQREGV